MEQEVKKTFWQGLSPFKKRVILIGASLLLIATFAFFLLKREYVPLYPYIPQEDIVRLSYTLDKLREPYKIKAETILVPKVRAFFIRCALTPKKKEDVIIIDLNTLLPQPTLLSRPTPKIYYIRNYYIRECP